LTLKPVKSKRRTRQRAERVRERESAVQRGQTWSGVESDEQKDRRPADQQPETHERESEREREIELLLASSSHPRPSSSAIELGESKRSSVCRVV
jgi:hypothetical protein